MESTVFDSTAQQISQTAKDISLLKKALNEQDGSITEMITQISKDQTQKIAFVEKQRMMLSELKLQRNILSSLIKKLVPLKTEKENLSFVLEANANLVKENREILEAKTLIEEYKDNLFNELQIVTKRCTNQALQLDRISDAQVDLRLSRIEVRQLRKDIQTLKEEASDRKKEIRTLKDINRTLKPEKIKCELKEMQNQLNMANRKIRDKEEVIAGFMKLFVGKSSSPN